MFIIPIIIHTPPEKKSYKWWGEPRCGGVESWKPTIITLISGATLKCPRFYDFSATDEFIYLCERPDDTGVWASTCGNRISKTNILNIELDSTDK